MKSRKIVLISFLAVMLFGLTLFIVPSVNVNRPLDFSDTDDDSFSPESNVTVAESNDVHLRWAGEPLTMKDVAWRHDAAYALVIGENGEIFRYDGIGFEEIDNVGITVKAVDWNPNDDYALIVGDGGNIRLFNESGIFTVSSSTVEDLYDVSFHSINEIAVIVGNAGVAIEWNGTSLTHVDTMTTQSLRSVSWHHSNPEAMIVGYAGVVLVYNSDTSEIFWLGSNLSLRDIAWNSDGSFSLIVGFSGIVIGYDGEKFQIITTSLGFNIYAANWNPINEEALLCGSEGNVVLYNQTGFFTIPSALTNALWDVEWKDDGAYALLVGDGGIILSCDGESLSLVTSKTSSNLRSIHWSSTRGDAIISGSNGLLLIYDPITGDTRWLSESVMMTEMAWRPDGTLAIIIGYAGLIITYDGFDFEKHITGLNSKMNDVAWRPDSSYAILVGESGQVVKYDGFVFSSLTSGVTVDLYTIEWNSDGSLAAIVGDTATILLYDQTDFEELERLSGILTTSFRSVSWNNDSILITGFFGTIIEYNTTSTEFLWHGYGTQLREVAWKHDGSSALIVGAGGALIEYDSSGFHILSPGISTTLNDVAWNISDNCAIIVGDDGIMSEYNGTHFWSLTPPTIADILDIAWSPDGSIALICGTNGFLMAYNGTYNVIDTGISATLYSASWTSAEGYAIIVGSGGTVLKFENGEISTISAPVTNNFWDVAWNQNGTYSLIVGFNRLYKFDGATFTLISSHSYNFEIEPAKIAWNPDGSFAYIFEQYQSSPTYRILKWDGSSLIFVTSLSNKILGMSWHPTSGDVFFVGFYGQVVSFDGSTPSYLTLGLSNLMWDAVWKPDASYALIVGFNRLYKYDGATFTLISSHSYNFEIEPAKIAWNPDGSFALVLDRNQATPINRIWRWDGSSLTNYVSLTNQMFGMSWRPGHSIAYQVGSVGQVSTTDGYFAEHLTFSKPTSLWDVAWNPDGSSALLIGMNYLYKYVGNIFTLLHSHGYNFEYEPSKIAWHPDGSFALITEYNQVTPFHRIWKCDGTSLSVYATARTKIWNLDWHPAGSYALIVGDTGEVIKYDGYKAYLLTPGTSRNLWDTSWKPDGSHALIAGEYGEFLEFDSKSFMYDIEDSYAFRTYPVSMDWSPNGIYCVVVGRAGNTPYDRIWSYDGATMIYFTVSYTPRGVSFIPSGDYSLIVGDSGAAWMYDAITVTPLSTGVSTNLKAVAWKPDGSYALAVGESGAVLKYDGSVFTTISSGFTETFTSIDWKPDGSGALIVGTDGVLVEYNGTGFTQIDTNVTTSFNRISCGQNDLAYAVGPSGTLIYINGTFTKEVDTGLITTLYGVDWSPNGAYAVITGGGGIVRLAFAGGKALFGSLDVVPSHIVSSGTAKLNIRVTDGIVPIDSALVEISAIEGSTNPIQVYTNTTGHAEADYYAPATEIQLFDTITLKLSKTDYANSTTSTSFVILETTPPNIFNVEHTPINPLENESVGITAHVEDAGGVLEVLLGYSSGGAWVNASMSYNAIDDRYKSTISEFPYLTEVSYRVYARDTSSQWNLTPVYNYQYGDALGPVISSVTNLPATPSELNDVMVSAIVTDPNGLDSVTLQYTISSTWIDVSMVYDAISGYWNGTIPAQSSSETITYRIQALDLLGNSRISSEYSYSPIDGLVPEISDIQMDPAIPTELDGVEVSAVVTDAGGIFWVILSYSSGGEWVNHTMVYSSGDGRYYGTIPSMAFPQTIFYKIYASDFQYNWQVSSTSSYNPSDALPPTIDSVNRIPFGPTEFDAVNITTEVSDLSGISMTILCYTIDEISTNITMAFSFVDGKYHAQIPSHTSGKNVSYLILVEDDYGNWATSESSYYVVGISCDFKILGVSTGILTGDYTPTSSFNPGDTVFISVLVENNGTAGGDAFIIIQVYNPGSQQVWIGYLIITNLLPSQTINMTVSFTLPLSAALGEYSIHVDVQSEWSILEPTFVFFDYDHSVKFDVV
ncbi:MAG: hypothetical protein ACTSV2_05720 [Candidatus Thorarchaeota archaeon]